MDAETRAAIEAELGGMLTAISHPPGLDHHNVHYRGTLLDGMSVFVKLINDDPAYYTAEVRAAHHLADTAIRTPRLVSHGALDERRRWLAYQWHDLAPFNPAPDHIEQAGELLGSLHAATAGISDPQIRRYPGIHALIAEKTARVADFDTALADRIRRLHAAITSRSSADPDDSTCLLHGDVGWRNFHAGPHDQQLWLIDFEHAAIGHRLLDFAKLWDRELSEPAARAAFLHGYRKHQPSITTAPEAINAVRLWAAAGIIPYARPRGDQDFEHHAYRILSNLEKGE